jgi:hypothetical protein
MADEADRRRGVSRRESIALSGVAAMTAAGLGSHAEAAVSSRASPSSSRASSSVRRRPARSPALRVRSNRQGDAASPYAQVRNLGRARVVVT